jgi:hypothetical protein
MTLEQLMIVTYISTLSGLIPVLIYLLRIKKVRREIHIIGLAVILSFASDTMGLYLVVIKKFPNAIVNNIDQVVQFFILSFFYCQIVFKNKWKIICGLGTLAFLSALVYSFRGTENFYNYPQTYMYSVSNFVFLVYGTIYLHHLITSSPVRTFRKFDLMWINAGILAYCGFCAYIHFQAAETFKMADKETGMLLWACRNASFILMHMCLAVGIYFSHKSLTISGEDIAIEMQESTFRKIRRAGN